MITATEVVNVLIRELAVESNRRELIDEVDRHLVRHAAEQGAGPFWTTEVTEGLTRLAARP